MYFPLLCTTLQCFINHTSCVAQLVHYLAGPIHHEYLKNYHDGLQTLMIPRGDGDAKVSPIPIVQALVVQDLLLFCVLYYYMG